MRGGVSSGRKSFAPEGLLLLGWGRAIAVLVAVVNVTVGLHAAYLVEHFGIRLDVVSSMNLSSALNQRCFKTDLCTGFDQERFGLDLDHTPSLKMNVVAFV